MYSSLFRHACMFVLDSHDFEADSARHVVSMGQLFSRLRTPDGGHWPAFTSSCMYSIHISIHASFLVRHVLAICPKSGRSELLSKMKSWPSQKNWSRNLHTLIYKFQMTLPVRMEHLDLPVLWRNEHVMMPWPTLPPHAWLDCIFKKTSGQPILAGHQLKDVAAWTGVFQDFWRKFKAARGDAHEVFTDHATQLGNCVPIMIHGDEGRGKLHRAVMATSVQPAILPGGHAGHSFNSRMLHSIMPGELYEGDHTIDLLQDALVEDLRKLYTDGFPVSRLPCHADVWCEVFTQKELPPQQQTF